MRSKRHRSRGVGPLVRTHRRRKHHHRRPFWFNHQTKVQNKSSMRRRNNLFMFGARPSNKIQVMEDIPPPPYTVTAGDFENYGVENQKFDVSQQSKTNVDISRGFMGSTHIGTQLPVAITCPYCYQPIVTKPIAKVGLLTWTACFVSIMLGLFLGCCLVPFCLKDFKDIYHICPNCKYTVDIIKKM